MTELYPGCLVKPHSRSCNCATLWPLLFLAAMFLLKRPNSLPEQLRGSPPSCLQHLSRSSDLLYHSASPPCLILKWFPPGPPVPWQPPEAVHPAFSVCRTFTASLPHLTSLGNGFGCTISWLLQVQSHRLAHLIVGALHHCQYQQPNRCAPVFVQAHWSDPADTGFPRGFLPSGSC